MADHIVRVVDNRVVVQVAGADVLLPLAQAATAANADRAEAALAQIEDIAAGAPDAPSVVAKADRAANLSDLGDTDEAVENLTYNGRSLADRLGDVVSVKDAQFAGGAKGDGTADDAPAIRAALSAASGGTVVFPKGVYRLGSSLGIIDQETRLQGAGRRNTILLRDFNGDYLATLRDGADLVSLCFDGNGSFGDYTAGRTGGLIDIPVSHGNQSIHDCRLINADGGTPLHIACTGEEDDEVGGSRLDVRNLEVWRSDSSPGSGRFAIVHDDPGVSAAGHPISMHHIETGGYESIAFGACNDLYLSHSSVFECSWSTFTRGLHVGASRFSGLTGYAINGTCDFSGVSFASAVTVAVGSFSQFPGCVFNDGYTDNSGASGVTSFLDGIREAYTPVFEAGGVAFTLGAATPTGHSYRIGSLIFFSARLAPAADTSIPSGAWTVSVPFAADANITQQGGIQVDYASSNGNPYVGIGRILAGASEVSLVANGGSVGDSFPGPLASGGAIVVSGWYAV